MRKFRSNRFRFVLIFILLDVIMKSKEANAVHDDNFKESELFKRDELDAQSSTEFEIKMSNQSDAGTTGQVTFTFTDANHTSTDKIELPTNQIAKIVAFSDLSFPVGSVNTFDLTEQMAQLGDIELLKLVNTPAQFSINRRHGVWRPELLTVRRLERPDAFFPIDRTLAVNKIYTFFVYDTHLPQNDPFPKQRRRDLKMAKSKYEYKYIRKNFPPMVKNIPLEEKQPLPYLAKQVKDLGLHIAISQYKKVSLNTLKWKSFKQMETLFTLTIKKPMYIVGYRDDLYFGRQRVQGANPVLIQRIKRIPKKFGVTSRMMNTTRLENKTLKKALAADKIFMTDLVDLDGFAEKFKRNVTAPMALFYLNKNNDLMPIAIQLFQRKSKKNPVFTPDDDPHTWLLAKFFYNIGESTHHQSTTHLGHTHFLLEPIIICAHRNLSPSHPVFRLLKPHFLYTFAINKLAYFSFERKGDFVDQSMNSGSDTLYLVGKAAYKWNLKRDATIKNLFKKHKVTKKYLPYYPFRDDVLDLYNAIKTYVGNVLKFYYDKQDIKNDHELQAFRLELTKKKAAGGLQLKGFPGSDDTGFSTVDEIIETVTGIIFTASVKHATVNFMTYDTLAFQPNYPLYLTGEIPTDKRRRTEEEILSYMPDRNVALDIMLVAKFLSYRATNSLGDFEVPRLYHPVAAAAVKEFQLQLREISVEIARRNLQRPWKYPWGDPDKIPNAVSA